MLAGRRRTLVDVVPTQPSLVSWRTDTSVTTPLCGLTTCCLVRAGRRLTRVYQSPAILPSVTSCTLTSIVSSNICTGCTIPAWIGRAMVGGVVDLALLSEVVLSTYAAKCFTICFARSSVFARIHDARVELKLTVFTSETRLTNTGISGRLRQDAVSSVATRIRTAFVFVSRKTSEVSC